jgi:hypothetical protein
VNVQIIGGPRHGDVMKYTQPLPKILCLYGDGRWNDYRRQKDSLIYLYTGREKAGAH